MPKVIIPDKICSHCGGNEWYILPSTNRITCYKKHRERNRKREKREAVNLSNWYIRHRIKHDLKREGINTKLLKISDRSVKIYRESILKIRKTKKIMKSFENYKNELEELYDVDTSKMSKEDKRNLYRKRVYVKSKAKKGIQEGYLTEEQYNELIALGPPPSNIDENKEEFIKLNNTKNLSTSEYNRHYYLKNKLRNRLDDKEYATLISTKIKVEQIKQTEQPKKEVESPIVKNQNAEDIIEEYRRLEKRRLEIIKEVEEFNNMVEQLKLIL